LSACSLRIDEELAEPNHWSERGLALCITARSFMKRLFSSPDSAEIGVVRSRLEALGIGCEIRNEHSSSAMLGAPFYPELWVLDDAQFSEAGELLAAWRQPGQT
jgi:hypothetical protein